MFKLFPSGYKHFKSHAFLWATPAWKRQKSSKSQKQPSRGVLRKRCSENKRQIYWRTSISKCDNFIEITLWGVLTHGRSAVNLLHIFRTLFPKNTYRGLLSKSQATLKAMRLNFCYLKIIHVLHLCYYSKLVRDNLRNCAKIRWLF